MDRPCSSCGAAVPEGSAFCAQCGARQGASAPDAVPPPAPPAPAAPGTPPPALPIDWSKAWLGVLIAGGVAGLISSAPVLSLGCCLWVLGAGAASVLIYRSRAAVSVAVGPGARLGMVTGAVAWLVNSALTTLGMLIMGAGKMTEAMRQGMEQSASRNPDPNAQAMAHRMMEFMASPGGLALIMTLWFVLLFLVLIAFGAGGGALGASLFGRRESSQ